MTILYSFELAETYGEEQESIYQVAKSWRNNVSAFIGPQETCEHEARLAASFNLPMISHFCTHRATSDKVSTFTIFCNFWVKIFVKFAFRKFIPLLQEQNLQLHLPAKA